MKYESKHGTVNFWDLYEDSLNRFKKMKGKYSWLRSWKLMSLSKWAIAKL